jgi:hypothetical protein
MNTISVTLRFIAYTILVSFLSSCATIIGGQKYRAIITVDDHPKAEISYNGTRIGKGGFATIKIPRKKANKIIFTVQQEGCEKEDFIYTHRKLRGWAFTGSILVFSAGSIIPISYGLLLDFALGSVWKPDNSEKGIIKNDYNHYNYILDYTGCNNHYTEPVIAKPIKTKEERLKQLKTWFDEDLITEEEYNTERQKILDE